jgi:hypothetical protein
MAGTPDEKKLAKADAQAAKAKAKALRPWFQQKKFIVPIALVAIIGISTATNSGGSDTTPSESSVTTPDTTEPEEVQEETVSETIGQKNARESAESYLNFSGFSRQGLIDQLEYEDYSTEDAEYAVDALDVDWNEQAARSAESYLEFQAFSKQGLIDQLVYEGYTKEEAQYGAKAVGY